MRIACLALSALWAAMPAMGRADAWQPSEEKKYSPRLAMGVRSGYSWGLGDVDSSMALKDVMAFQIPVQLDVGLRFHPEYSVGVYASYGFSRPTGATKDLCDAYGVSCSASGVRAGVQVLRYFSERSQPSPLWRDPHHSEDESSYWLGVGLGYDAITVSMSGGGGSTDVTASGIEWNVAAGFDFYTGPRSTMGLYASLSVARFTDLKAGGTSGTISDQKLHEWLTLGLHAEYGR